MGVEDYLIGKTIHHEASVDLDKLRAFQKKHDEHTFRRTPDPPGGGSSYKYLYQPSTVCMDVTII